MKNKIRKISGSILSFALAAAMVIGMSGTATFAADANTDDSVPAADQRIIVKEQADSTVPADTSFPYHLYQVTEADYPIESISDIKDFTAGDLLPYTIYDTETNEEIEVGTTDEDGGFSLKAGEYAEFFVTAETDWYVYQDEPKDYPLISKDPVTAEGEHASVVDVTYGVVQYEHGGETTEVDKSKLQAEYDDDIELNESDYTPESWAPFEAALEKAKEVLDDDNATQEEVDQALEDLINAREGLEKPEPAETVDKSKLQAEYDADILLNEPDYTPESWAPFEEALDKALEVLNDEDATQEEVDDALEELQEAREGLQEVEKVDKTALQKEYDSDITLNESDYTPESWAPFEDAMEHAKEVLDDENATQEEVDQALEELQEAREALEKVPEPTPEPGQPTVSVSVSSNLTDNTKTYNGEGVTLTAKAEGSEGTTLTYQWYLYDEETGAFQAIDGATNATLDLAGNVSDGGMYECTVTATDESGNEASDSAAITITIEKAEQDISYAVTLVEKTVGDEPFTNDLTVTKLSDEAGAGITYTSNDETVATVDPVTGEVTILRDGTVAITATAAETANYAEKTAVYVINITEPEPTPTPSVDKSALQKEYDADLLLNEPDYTPESWAPFADAMEHAKEVLDDDNVTQEDVDEALEELQEAREALERVPEPVQPTVSVTITSNLADNTKTYDGEGATLTASVSVEPEGAEVSYQWYAVAEDGTETLIEGATFSVFTTGGNVSDSGTYKCVVTATNDGLTATAEDSITITIEKAAQDISYETAVVTKYDYDDDFTNELTETVVVGEITYTSSDESVATVDPETGEVQIVGTGYTVITATAAGSDNYEEATASYTLTVNTDTVGWEVKVNGRETTWDEEKEEWVDDLTYNGNPLELEMVITLTAQEEAELEGITYQWYRYDSDQKDYEVITGATESTYTLEGEDVNVGDYLYMCEAVITYSNGFEHTIYGPVEVIIEKAQQEISYEETAVEKRVTAEPFTNPLTETTVDTKGGATITYASSDESVATVDAETGEVTIIGPGTATITATVSETTNYEEASASYTLTVPEPVAPTVSVEVTSTLVDNTKKYDGIGVSLTANVTVEPDTAEIVSYQWYKENAAGEYEPIEDATYSLLNIEGNVSDSGTYKCVVTATNDGLTETAEGTITITIEKAAQDISYETTVVTKYDYDDDFTNELTKTVVVGEITYTSSDESVATVDPETGEVQIVGTGYTVITATAAGNDNYEEATASYTLTVNTDTVDWEVKVNGREVTWDEEKEEWVDDLTYTGDPLELEMVLNLTEEEEAEVAEITYQWYRYDPDLNEYEPIEGATESTYDLKGEDVNAGDYLYMCEAVITYSNGFEHTIFGPVEVIIEKAQQEISYAETALEKKVTDKPFTNPLTVTTVDTKGGATITYTSSDESVATVDENGKVTIVGPGTATITATVSETTNYEGTSASYTLTVPEPVAPTLSVEITSDITGNTKTYDGDGVTLTANVTVEPETAEIVSYQWYTVAGDGTETAIKGATKDQLDLDGNVSDSGTYKCVVTATNDGVTETAEGTITITIEKAAQDISYETTVVTKYDFDEDFTNELTQTVVFGEITYTSSDETVATVDPKTGEVHIEGTGYAVITATAAGNDNYEEAEASYTLAVNTDTVDWEIDVDGREATWDEEKEEWIDDLTYNGNPLELEMVITLTEEEEAELVGISYQWYRYDPDLKDYEPITGATEDAYKLEDEDVNAGDYLYMCMAVITYSNGFEHTIYSPIEVIIEQAQQEISYEETAVEKTVDDKAFTNELTKTLVDPADGSGITYTSSDESVATVDPKTGEVTIVGPGTATITATAAETTNYEEATASYTLTVTTIPTVNYAVKVWGIKQDTYLDEEGNEQTAGLTFGPATGASYLNDYVSRETVGEEKHPSEYCIHDMEWSEIIEQNAKDPTVFEDCKTNGCTKAVELTPNTTLFNMTTVNNAAKQNYTGDGVGTLYYLLNGTGSSTYSRGAIWNYSETGSSTSDPANIYSRSRMRATLTGDQENIKEWMSTSGHNDYYGMDTLCDESNCLLSCFPEELQSAVVPRTTLNSGNRLNYPYVSANDKTTYDKLFLFSYNELSFSRTSSNSPDDSGGDDYGLFSENWQRVAYEYSDVNATGSAATPTWMRGRDCASGSGSYAGYQVGVVWDNGSQYVRATTTVQGVAPGFCLPGAEAVQPTVSVTVTSDLPNNEKVYDGKDVTLTATATYTPDDASITYQWYKENESGEFEPIENATESTLTLAGEVSDSGTYKCEVTATNSGLTATADDEITITITEPTTVSYAVKIWGIQKDSYSTDGGETTKSAGLTFGPALGADYTNSYVSCDSAYCIHNMTWSEIIEQSEKDPTVFDSCLKNGCTKAVELTPNTDLFNMTTVNNALAQSYSGDGVGTLNYLLKDPAYTSGEGAYWNFSVSGTSSSDPANVYSRSRIRATLTGDSKDAKEMVSSGYNDYYGVDTLCDETNCLLTCFPEELQSAIVPRMTQNTGNASSGTSVNDKTTYDELFLFSRKEMGDSISSDDSGGDDYGIISGSSERVAYEFSSASATSTESQFVWLRSRCSYYTYGAMFVDTSGNCGTTYNVNNDLGLSPGFCLPGPEIEQPTVSVTVTSDLPNNEKEYDGKGFTLTATPTYTPDNATITYQWYKENESGEFEAIENATESTLTLDGNISDSGTYKCEVTAANGGLTATADDEITITITGSPTVSYAVKIWGIQADKYSDDGGETTHTAGLTFGPATGESYLNTYVSCDSEYCIHNMTWDEIIAQSKEDPTVFQSCLENGCTKAVELNPNSDLFDMSVVENAAKQNYEGDGVSTLAYLIGGYYSDEFNHNGYWNDTVSGYSVSDPANVYSRSRIRITLTGDSSYLDKWVEDGGKNYASDTYPLLDESNCLFSCFPSELQEAIVPRETQNGGNGKAGSYLYADATTYDTLWLFSLTEVGIDYNYDDAGGTDYGLYSGDTNSGRVAYEFSDATATSSEAQYWWLRSRHSNSAVNAFRVITTGGQSTGYPYYGYGISPSFCLPGPDEEPGPEPESPSVKYAVSIWGIQQDTYVDEDGEEGTAGLTFGPATGANYVDSYVSRETVLAEGGSHDSAYCIHDMDWDEIAAQSKEDPSVFEDCLENGCTKAVDITLNSSLQGTSYTGDMTGDGAGVLYYSINDSYRAWNATASNSGGWPASRMRATLNGKDDDTDTSVAGSDVLDASDSLFSCFPTDLQDAIVAKAVKSDTVYNSQTEENNQTTYDKLWLFSGKEAYADSGYNNGMIRSNEGDLYTRSTIRGITSSIWTGMRSYCEEGSVDTYDSYGSWWIRSLNISNNTNVDYVMTSGDWSTNDPSVTTHGLSPGFCMAGPEVEPEPEQSTINYAVKIWGIGDDTYSTDDGATTETAGLTFGPALGDNSNYDRTGYINSYKAHLTEEEYKADDDAYCIHWMTWDEIIEQNAKDPSVFADCKENGCTKALELTPNEKLFNLDAVDAALEQNYTGDGVTTLYYLLNGTGSESYSEGATWNYTSSSSYDYDNPSNIYSKSRIRVTLNGDASDANETYAGTGLCDETNCLLSCFPSELQSVIVPRATVNSGGGASWGENRANDKETYDKLWLLSVVEAGIDESNDGYYDGGGTDYGIAKSDGNRVAYEFSSADATTVMARGWWTRSRYTADANSPYYISNSGGKADNRSDANAFGLSPCFSLPGPEEEETETVRYAVSIWGINQDMDEDGNVLGLTFGPATGDNYVHTYKAHLDESEYSPASGKYCIHWMSWDEIIEQCKADPTVFQDCLDSGCTHTVVLSLNSTIRNASFTTLPWNAGDGGGQLFSCINTDYLKWNSSATTEGGWPASQIRAVLNGKDDLTGDNAANALNAKDSLLSCFPSELQEGIVAKAVKSDTVYDDTTDNTKTTYDKLWLFSGTEAWGPGGYSDSALRANEGSLYERSSKMGITTANYEGLKSYDETGESLTSVRGWWTRTQYIYNSTYPIVVGYLGDWNADIATSATNGLAPGFCLAGPYYEQPTVTDVTITAEGLEDGNTKTYDGEPVTLTASATTTPDEATVTYQWYKVDGDDVTAIAGATDSSLELEGKVSDSGTYRCVVTATNGNKTADDYADITITINAADVAKVKYAVKIWGIQADEYSTDGGATTETAGLTFGPALGADYLNDSVSCDSQYCIHDMEWSDIIAQSAKDPSVFEGCLKNGCTKTVELTPNETLFNMTAVENAELQNFTGDGVSTLNYLLNGTGSANWTHGAIWNYTNTGSSTSDPSNIYSKSRIRVTLNGDSTDAEMKYASSDNGEDLCDETNCLLSCFPSELQSAIVPRLTENTGNATSTSYSSAGDKTTYDKLFLFSLAEAGVVNELDDSGGSDYGIATSASDRVAYEFMSESNMTSRSYAWWTRSRYLNDANQAYLMSTSGTASNYNAIYYGGLSPAFCLPGPDDEASDEYNMKYAVSIWGIEQDTYQDADGNEETAGLTFGPATGADYTGTYEAHLTEDEYNASDDAYCIHWMSWSEIAAQSEEDPSVFEDCLKNGCTKSVDIELNETLLNSDYETVEFSGDGAGMLYESIPLTYRKWNSADDTEGGWPASRMRATLNGADELTVSSEAGTDTLSAGDSLFSCFPSELRNVIVPKAVKSDTVCTDTTGNNTTTYDKLWLFSGREILMVGNYYNSPIRTNEGNLYQRSEQHEITTQENYSNLVNYSEKGSAAGWWLRSQYVITYYQVYYIWPDGECYTRDPNNEDTGIAPGFCLAGPAEKEAEQPTVSVEVTSDLTNNEKEYDGKEVTLTATATYTPDDATVSYQWYKDGDEIDPTAVKPYAVDTDTYTLAGEVSDSGTYKCIVTATNGDLTATAEGEVTITITEPESDTHNVKYAVSIYGIEEDVDEDGNLIGLTFGPATGANYKDTYKAHLDESAYDPDNGDYCIHWMSWDEIIAQSKKDPSVFEDCLKNGCTHAVDIAVNDTLYDESYGEYTQDGDGTGMLYFSMKSTYRYWNATGSNTGGWPASRIRATLNGADDSTDKSVAGSDVLSEEDSLFSCFPSELQEAITAKAVKSDTVYNNQTEANNKTTYDKLWLFSGKEVYGDSESNNNPIRYNEGSLYQRSTELGITSSNYSGLTNYYENGSSAYWWLRSQNTGSATSVYYITATGDWNYNTPASGGYSVAPGFCIAGPGQPAPEPEEKTVNYAVKIWGIQTDTYLAEDENGNETIQAAGLTFGPALGADYTNDSKAHLEEDACDPENGKYCIHWMSWDDIIEQSEKDPTVFADCLSNGCTKAVELTTNDNLFDMTTVDNASAQGYTGDGVSTLAELVSTNKNYYWNENATDNSADDPANVYSRSRIRTALIGDPSNMEAWLDEGSHNNYYYSDTYPLLTESTCLLSCFPEELQEAIVPRTTVNAGTPTYGTSYGDKVTYDKLWIFSPAEVGVSSVDGYDDGGGTDYGIAKGNSDRIAYEYSNASAASSAAKAWWTRSRNNQDEDSVYYVMTIGEVSSHQVDREYYGLSPSFCLAGPEDEEPEPESGDYNVKYAVSVWGIEQDVDEEGNTLGLTFGPATGEDYTGTYKAHEEKSAYDPNNSDTYCIHWMTWDEIVAQSAKDPSVFETCLEDGCTKAVAINLNDTLLADGYDVTMTGDGAGMLLDSITTGYRTWNAAADPYNNSGWPASRVRATLNGKDDLTDTGFVAGSDALNASDCLLSCFPEELQENIVAKEVVSDTSYSLSTVTEKTTYDKLWLFAESEIFTTGTEVRSIEGARYKRSEILGITNAATQNDPLINYGEDGTAHYWWLRTLYSDPSLVAHINTYGYGNSRALNSTQDGIAPGFCLAGPTEEEPEPDYDEYNVKYAVNIWGIQQDVDEDENTLGLTFGPATGESYLNAYAYHLPEDECDPDNGKCCIHWMTWAEIAAQSKKDPTVFEDCLKAGCTKAVALDLNETLLNNSYEDMKGDGAGVLWQSIQSSYRKWNNTDSATGGWPASRIRATLNGADDYTDTSRAGTDLLTSEDCLLSCFPSVLQKNIVAKKVQSDTVYNNTTGSNETTYDKLWLFSGAEVYGASGTTDDNVIRANEGQLYERSEYLEITPRNYSALMNYDETGPSDNNTGARAWWLRSMYYQSYQRAWYVPQDGIPSSAEVSSASYGISPGFCLQ